MSWKGVIGYVKNFLARPILEDPKSPHSVYIWL
jgi:hypothetical protein